MIDGFTPEQERAARRAKKAFQQLRESGLMLIWHSATGNIYAVHQEDFINPDGAESLECGKINDGGDW